MKKVLSTVAALGLVAGIAASASALELKVKGEYTVEGYSISDARGIYSDNALAGLQLGVKPGEDATTNAWFEHKFEVNSDLIINDNITIKSRLRFIDWGVWGKQDDTNIYNGNNFSVRRLWMVYKSPVGIWEIGRRPAGAWENDFVNTASRGDRIMWKSGKMLSDVFNMYAFYQKVVEGDVYSSSPDAGDLDYYEIYGAYTGFGKSALAFGVMDDTVDYAGGMNSTREYYRIKGYGDYQFTDMLGLEMEFDYKWDSDYGVDGVDYSGFAFMADLQADFGAAKANFMYFYISGDDGTDATERTAYSTSSGTGADFEPLYILTGGKTGILNNDCATGATTFGGYARTAGAHGFVGATDFQATEKLGLHGAVGYAKAADEMPGFDSDYGWEVNAGLSYKLLDNLTYNAHFGYLWTGDFFKMGGSWTDVNDITFLYNNLSMSF